MEQKSNIKNVVNEFKSRDTYEVKHILVNPNGTIDRVIYENDELFIKTPSMQHLEDSLNIRRLLSSKDEFKQLIERECGRFYFNFYDRGLLSMDIKESIKSRFLYLCTYTNYADKGMYLCFDNGKRMKRKDIAEILELSEREFKTTLKTMLDNKLLTQDNEYFIVNKNIAIRGQLNGKQEAQAHTRVFDKGLRELYKNCKVSQHKQLYYLFRLLPYVNVKCNAICQNPSEQNVNDVIVLKLKEICEVVGYDTTKSSRFLNEMLKLQLFDQYAILGIRNAKGTWYKINPRIVYAGTSGHLEEFKELLATDFSVNK